MIHGVCRIHGLHWDAHYGRSGTVQMASRHWTRSGLLAAAVLVVGVATPAPAAPAGNRRSDARPVTSAPAKTVRPADRGRNTRRRLEGKPVSSKLLRSRWDEWRKMTPEQRRGMLQRWRGLVKTDPERSEAIIRGKEELDRQDPATIERLRRLKKRYEAFVASLSAQERKRLLAMTPKARAGEVASILGRQRLDQSKKPSGTGPRPVRP